MESKETRLFCLRVMVGVIILYDHVDPVGAFQKKSAIDVSVLYITLYWLLYSTCVCTYVHVVVSYSVLPRESSNDYTKGKAVGTVAVA